MNRYKNRKCLIAKTNWALSYQNEERVSWRSGWGGCGWPPVQGQGPQWGGWSDSSKLFSHPHRCAGQYIRSKCKTKLLFKKSSPNISVLTSVITQNSSSKAVVLRVKRTLLITFPGQQAWARYPKQDPIMRTLGGFKYSASPAQSHTLISESKNNKAH